MSEFYRVLFEENDAFGVAYTTTSIDVQLPYTGEVTAWSPLRLELREGSASDFLASNLGLRLCSGRLKSELMQCLSPQDVVQWLPVTVNDKDRDHDYFILHFPLPPDVLDRTHTTYANDFVVRPVLASELASPHNVFTYSPNEGLPWFVSRHAKNALEHAGCTGMEFSTVKCV